MSNIDDESNEVATVPTPFKVRSRSVCVALHFRTDPQIAKSNPRKQKKCYHAVKQLKIVNMRNQTRKEKNSLWASALRVCIARFNQEIPRVALLHMPESTAM